MALSFNGTVDFASVAVDLSSYSVVSLSFWLLQPTFTATDLLAMEYTPNYNSNNGFLCDPNSGGGTWAIGFTTAAGATHWDDTFTRPSAAAWHHYLLVFDRATPVSTAYVDGASATLTSAGHTAATYGNFANSTLYLASRGGTTLFNACYLSEVVIWGGVALGSADATALNSGTNPMSVHASPLLYVIGRQQATRANEVTDQSGNGRNLSLTGAVFVADPPAVAQEVDSPMAFMTQQTITNPFGGSPHVGPRIQ